MLLVLEDLARGGGAAHDHPQSRDPHHPATQPKQKESELRKREELLGLLRAHEGNVSAVARALGKARPQVQRWLKRYGIRDGNRS